jgi:hypothetical protein
LGGRGGLDHDLDFLLPLRVCDGGLGYDRGDVLVVGAKLQKLVFRVRSHCTTKVRTKVE